MSIQSCAQKALFSSRLSKLYAQYLERTDTGDFGRGTNAISGLECTVVGFALLATGMARVFNTDQAAAYVPPNSPGCPFYDWSEMRQVTKTALGFFVTGLSSEAIDDLEKAIADLDDEGFGPDIRAFRIMGRLQARWTAAGGINQPPITRVRKNVPMIEAIMDGMESDPPEFADPGDSWKRIEKAHLAEERRKKEKDEQDRLTEKAKWAAARAEAELDELRSLVEARADLNFGSW